MTAKERILAAIEKTNGPVCDDCMVKLAELSFRQESNKICTSLYAEGVIDRGNHKSCIICGKIKITNWSPEVGNAASPELAKIKNGEPASESVKNARPWYWEGNIQAPWRPTLSAKATVYALWLTPNHGFALVAHPGT